MKIREVLRSSEFWVAIVVAILNVLAQFGVLDQPTAMKLAGWTEFAFQYAAARVAGKLAKKAMAAPPPKVVPLVALFAIGLALASPASAEEVSLFHKDRIRLSVVVGGEWNADDPFPALKNSLVAGPTIGYPLTQHVSLVVPVQVGVPSGIIRTAPQVRWRFQEGFAVGFGHEFYARGQAPGQWVASAVYAVPVWKSWSIGVTGSVGLEQQEFRSQVLIGHTFVHGKER